MLKITKEEELAVLTALEVFENDKEYIIQSNHRRWFENPWQLVCEPLNAWDDDKLREALYEGYEVIE